MVCSDGHCQRRSSAEIVVTELETHNYRPSTEYRLSIKASVISILHPLLLNRPSTPLEVYVGLRRELHFSSSGRRCIFGRRRSKTSAKSLADVPPGSTDWRQSLRQIIAGDHTSMPHSQRLTVGASGRSTAPLLPASESFESGGGAPPRRESFQTTIKPSGWYFD